jgi:hypothetical protein
MTQGFYWNLDEGTRAFARRYFARQHAMPSQGQAGAYSAVTHSSSPMAPDCVSTANLLTNSICCR